MRHAILARALSPLVAACGPTPEERDAAVAGWTHPMGVARGPEGHGAPHWGLPPPDQKMA